MIKFTNLQPSFTPIQNNRQNCSLIYFNIYISGQQTGRQYSGPNGDGNNQALICPWCVTVILKYLKFASFSKKKTGLSNLFIYPTNAQLDCSKRMLQFTLIFTLKVLLHVSVKTTIIRELAICVLLKL